MSTFCWGKSLKKFARIQIVLFCFIFSHKFQQTFKFDVIANMNLDLPDPNFAGEYMANMMVHFKGVDEYLCTNIFGEFYRV